MATVCEVRPKEKSTFIITATFRDEEGELVIPKSGLNWTLTDRQGNIVNGREAVVISPSTEVNIVLTGDDLAVDSTLDSVKRYLSIRGTYDSTYGTDLNITDEYEFEIDDLRGIS